MQNTKIAKLTIDLFVAHVYKQETSVKQCTMFLLYQNDVKLAHISHEIDFIFISSFLVKITA